MDTRLQALFTYMVSGDDRLARRAIHDLHSSQLPNGMLQSRYPSVFPQVIPGFSLYWIMMVHDHYWHHADVHLVREYLPTIDRVLGWFDGLVGEYGLVGQMPRQYWSFVDWVGEWHRDFGVPPANREGPLTVYNFMYAATLDMAAQLNVVVGRESTSQEYCLRAAAIREAVNRSCWSPDRMMYRDGPKVEEFSQHSQIWAVLSEAITDIEAEQLLRRMMMDDELPQASYAMAFFLFRALEITNLYDLSFPLWDTWREMAALDLTTWVEDPVTQRSDCHGWGSVPLYEFTAEILGVKPGKPGYRQLRIEPKIGPLTWAKGKVATPVGLVEVEWMRTDEGEFELLIHAPDNIPVDVHLPNGEYVSLDQAMNHRIRCKL